MQRYRFEICTTRNDRKSCPCFLELRHDCLYKQKTLSVGLGRWYNWYSVYFNPQYHINSVLVQATAPSMQEMEAGGSVQGHPWLHSKFKHSQAPPGAPHGHLSSLLWYNSHCHPQGCTSVFACPSPDHTGHLWPADGLSCFLKWSTSTASTSIQLWKIIPLNKQAKADALFIQSRCCLVLNIYKHQIHPSHCRLVISRALHRAKRQKSVLLQIKLSW